MTAEAETQEWKRTSPKFPDKTRTLELVPESRHFSSSLEKKKEKPVIIRELSPLTVSVGHTATFTIRVSSFPEPTVQWLHNGQKITSSSVFTFRCDADEFSLIIGPVQRGLEGEYSCTVSNKLGQSTSMSYLHINVSEPEVEGRTFTPPGKPPQFVKTIESLQLFEGGEAFFRYSVTGEPHPDIQWLKGSFHMQPSGFCIIVNKPDGSGFMNIKSVQQQHSGLYTCKASNQYGEASCSAELLISRQEIQKEQTLAEKPKGLKITLSKQTAESRLVQEGTPSDQMIYTLNTDSRQIIPSEEVGILRDLNVSAASLHREQLTHQTAVLQSHDVQERVSLAPPHPDQVTAVAMKQHHMTSFLSSVQERPRIMEQHSERILSPELVEVQLAKEQPSKLLTATSEEVLALSTVGADALTDPVPERGKTSTEPRLPVSGHQVDSALPILDETVGVTLRPEKERSFKITEGLKLLYTAQSTGQLPITAQHSESLPALQTPNQLFTEREQPKPVVAAVSETRVALSKEKILKIQGPKQENISPHKDLVCKSAVTADEKYLLQGEQTGRVPGLVSSVSLQPQGEEEQVLNLQVISDQDVLQSEGRFSREQASNEQAETRRSPVLLHSVTQEDLQTVACEVTSELSAKTSSTSIQPKKESQQTRYLQSVHSPPVLAKEGILTIFTPDQQVATLKQEKVRRYAATSEERRQIRADGHKDFNASVLGLQSQYCIEPRPVNILSVSCQNTQLPKETPFIVGARQQRALIQKEDYWNIVHSLDVTETQTLEEGHTLSLKTVETFKPEMKTEPKISKRIVFIEDKAVATESCAVLQAAEQDFAVQIHEGQSVRQSVLLEEKQVIVGEKSFDMRTCDSSTVKVVTQPKEVLFVHESQETQTLPKELHFVIQVPKVWSLNVRHQLRDALQSAVATDRPVLLADVLGRLEAVEVREVKILREPERAMYTYLISAPGAPMEITLSFEGDYPQTVDPRSELQIALHAMVSHERQSLISEEPGSLQTERPQRALVCSAPAKEVMSSVVDTLMVAESAAGFPPTPTCQSASIQTEDSTSFQSVTVQSWTNVHELFQASRIMEKSETTTEDRGLDVFVQQETREEFLSEAVMISESSDSLLDFPVVLNSLQDICVEKNGKAVLSATVKNVSRVDWFFRGRLLESGTEFKCSKDRDTYTLVIDQVQEKHQGEFVCEAENEAGRTTTSCRLSVVSRGLMMFFCHHHLTSHAPCPTLLFANLNQNQVFMEPKTSVLFEVSPDTSSLLLHSFTTMSLHLHSSLKGSCSNTHQFSVPLLFACSLSFS